MNIKDLDLGKNYLLRKHLPGRGRTPSIHIFVPVRLIDKRTNGKVVVESVTHVPENFDPDLGTFPAKLANGEVTWKKKTVWTEVRAADLKEAA